MYIILYSYKQSFFMLGHKAKEMQIFILRNVLQKKALHMGYRAFTKQKERILFYAT